MSSATPLVELRQAEKRYAGAWALKGVDFTLLPGEVHVLFGENGAGKSTLISLISGVCQPTAGTLLVAGTPQRLQSVQHARQLGISAVFQEFSLVGSLTVAQNLLLGAEPTRGGLLDSRRAQQQVDAILQRLGFVLPPSQAVERLSRAEQQMVEIAKAFRSHLSVLILDEPTASLTTTEAERLFVFLGEITATGVAVVYVTHRLSEIHRIGSRVSVLRDGRLVATVPEAAASDERLLELMTGSKLSQIFPRRQFSPGKKSLTVRHLRTADGRVRDLSFVVRRGEIVGFAGLAGAGQSEALRACCGVQPTLSGDILFEGRAVRGKTLREMLRRGLFYNTRDRHAEGLVMERSGRENMMLAALQQPTVRRFGLLQRHAERRLSTDLARRMRLQPEDPERLALSFSGGNQQKLLLARCLTRPVCLYVFDEPTAGVDVSTRAAIYRFIVALCHAGAAVVLISSELAEIVHLTHRVYVMSRGYLAAELQGDQIKESEILRHFFDAKAVA